MSLFDIAKLSKDLENLEQLTMETDFWNDSKKSGKVLQEIKITQISKKAFSNFTESL